MAQYVTLIRNGEDHSLIVNASGENWQQLAEELNGARLPVSGRKLTVTVIWGRGQTLNEHLFLLKLAHRVSGRYQAISWNVRRGLDERSEEILARI